MRGRIVYHIKVLLEGDEEGYFYERLVNKEK